MSTRVQKGSTVFRPVAKSRPRPIEGTSTQLPISQDSRTAHPPSEVHKAPFSGIPGNIPTVIIPKQSIFLPRVSIPERIDHSTPAVIANTSEHVVPTVESSSVPLEHPTHLQRPPSPNEFTTPAGPSYAIAAVTERAPHLQGKRRSRSKSLVVTSPKKLRKVRRPVTPAFGVDAHPGEDLDPTSVTMAALCEDTGQGRVSSKAAQILDNHLVWRKSNKERRTRMKMRMEARKYGRNEECEAAQVSRPEGDSEQVSATNTTPGPPSVQPVSVGLTTVGDTSGQGFDYSQNVSTSRYNVQVRIGPNGETIIDEESLFVDRNAEEDTAEYTHVEESDVTKFVNSATYSKRFRGSRWSAEETELFYDALSQFGENYELISYILPGRDRKACKNKFKSEDKRNPQRINYCLKNRKPYDIPMLSRMTGKDFSGPTPEIRAPTILSLGELRDQPEDDQPLASGQSVSSSLTTTAGPAEEVVGDISSNFNPE